jgi:hypothetical protein
MLLRLQQKHVKNADEFIIAPDGIATAKPNPTKTQ